MQVVICSGGWKNPQLDLIANNKVPLDHSVSLIILSSLDTDDNITAVMQSGLTAMENRAWIQLASATGWR